MKRTVLTAVVAVISTGLLVSTASAAPAAPSGLSVQGATALLEGELLLVADAHRGEAHGSASELDHDDAVQAFLDVGDGAVPVEASAVEGLASGSVVTVEVAVPDAVATAVAQGEPVPITPPSAGGDEAVIPPGALDAARSEPAPADSDLAAATAVAAGDSQAPVEASVVQVVPAATAPASGGAHEVTVAVVGVNGKTDARYTDGEVSRLVGEVSGYWSDQTGGAVTYRLAGKATRWTSTIGCANFWDLWSEARTRTGFQGGPDKHLVLLLPRGAYDVGACGYGLGTIGNGVSTGGLSYVADDSWPALAHELGHNMSLQHANRLACTVETADTPQNSDGSFAEGGCDEDEYGDLADVMSSSNLNAAGGLGAVGLRKLGLLGAADQQVVTGRGVTSVALAPLGSGGGLRVASVTDPRNGNVYHLENRQAVGRDVYGFGGGGLYDATHPYGAPAGLRVLKRGARGTSVLLDPTPSVCGTYCPWDDDVVIASGTTFRSVADGVEIRPRQLADGSVVADVSVAGAGETHWSGVPSLSTVAPDPTSAVAVPGTAFELTGAVTDDQGRPASGLVRVTSASGSPAEGALDEDGRYRVAWTPTMSGTAKVSITHVTTGGQVGGTAEQIVRVGEATVVTVAAVKPRSTATTPLHVTVTTAARVPVPGGTVTVTAGDVRLAGATVSRGRATLVLPALPRGRQDLVVAYEPPPAGTPLAGSSAVLPLDVLAATARVTASLALRTVTIADAPSVRVSVSASGATPTGTVTVTENGTALGSGELVRGRATVELPVQALGRHSLVATYDGDSTVVGASSAPAVLTVTPLPVSAVSATVSRATAGQQATVTATVRAAGRPGSGEVSVVRDGQSVASGQLVGGRVVLQLPALPAGRHQLSVVHAGSERVTGGAKALALVVTPAKPSIRAVLGSATVTQGSTATITVDVSAPGVEAAGTVRLVRSRTVLDEAGLVDGRAVLTVPADLPVGRQSLTVAYAGSSELAAGSVTVPVTVVR